MAKPWRSIETVPTPDGPRELRQRDDDDFLSLIGGRVLMNSRQNRSEVAVGERPCRALAGHPAPFVRIGGLGIDRRRKPRSSSDSIQRAIGHGSVFRSSQWRARRCPATWPRMISSSAGPFAAWAFRRRRCAASSPDSYEWNDDARRIV